MRWEWHQWTERSGVSGDLVAALPGFVCYRWALTQGNEVPEQGALPHPGFGSLNTVGSKGHRAVWGWLPILWLAVTRVALETCGGVPSCT